MGKDETKSESKVAPYVFLGVLAVLVVILNIRYNNKRQQILRDSLQQAG